MDPVHRKIIPISIAVQGWTGGCDRGLKTGLLDKEPIMKRVLLFFATNILVVVTLSIVLRVLGIGNYFTAQGIDYGALLAFCFVWGMGGAFISLGISRIMAKWMMGVKLIDPTRPGPHSHLVDTVHRLAQQAKLPAMPEVGVYQSPEINAFATGPTKSRALVAVSSGLLERMSRDEMEGVLAHEVAHIANGDMVTMTLIQGVINAFVMFFARVIAYAVTSNMRAESRMMVTWMITIALEIGLGVLGYMVIAWFSRHREYRADAGGALYAGKQKMIGALQVLQGAYGREHARGEDKPAIASLKISGKQTGFMALMATHPPLTDRIARLRAAQA